MRVSSDASGCAMLWSQIWLLTDMRSIEKDWTKIRKLNSKWRQLRWEFGQKNKSVPYGLECMQQIIHGMRSASLQLLLPSIRFLRPRHPIRVIHPSQTPNLDFLQLSKQAVFFISGNIVHNSREYECQNGMVNRNIL